MPLPKITRGFHTSTKSIDLYDKQIRLHYVFNNLNCERKAQKYSAIAKQHFLLSKERRINEKLAKQALADKREWLEFEIYDLLKKETILRDKLNLINCDPGEAFLSFSTKELIQDSFHIEKFFSIVTDAQDRQDFSETEKSLRRWLFDGKAIELCDLSNRESCEKQAEELALHASKCHAIHELYQQTIKRKYDDGNEKLNPKINVETAILEHLLKISIERHEKYCEDKKRILFNRREWQEIRVTDPLKPNVEKICVHLGELFIDSTPFFFESALKEFQKTPTEEDVCSSEEVLLQRWFVDEKVIALWRISNKASCEKQDEHYLQNSLKHERFCKLFENPDRLCKFCGNPVNDEKGLIPINPHIRQCIVRSKEYSERKAAIREIEIAILTHILKISKESYQKYQDIAQKILSNKRETLEIRVRNLQDLNITKESIDFGGRSLDAFAIPYLLKCDPVLDSSGFPDFSSPSLVCDEKQEEWQDPIPLSENETIQLLWKENKEEGKFIWRLVNKIKKTSTWIDVNKDSLLTIRALERVSSEYKKIYLLKCRIVVNRSHNRKLESVSIKFVSKWNSEILLDEEQWAITLLSTGSGSDCYGPVGGHAVLSYEGVENGLPFRCYAHLTAVDGPPRVVDKSHELLGEKYYPILIYEHYKTLFYVRKQTKTWVRNRGQVLKMCDRINNEYQSTCEENQPANFNIIAPLFNSFFSEDSISARRQNKTLPENCLSWSVKTVKYADIDLPEPVWPEPDRYIEMHDSKSEKIKDIILNSTSSFLQSMIPSLMRPTKDFGAHQWVKYFGLVGDDIGIEPPFPPFINEILQAPCPFWPSKKVEETHLLLLMPKVVQKKSVNQKGKKITEDKLLTLKILKELVKKPKKGKAMDDTSFLDNMMSEHGDTSIDASYWILITKKGVKDNGSLVLPNKHMEKIKFSYEIATPLEAGVAVCMEYVSSGTKLHNLLFIPLKSITNSHFLKLSI